MLILNLFACMGEIPLDSEAGTETGAADHDQDGWPEGLDCDDADGSINPAALEECNGVDDDCDGEADDGVGLTVYLDDDGDGWGEGNGFSTCNEVEGYVEVDGDCDDADAAVNPGAAEVCNGIDDDCDGAIETDWATWYPDADGDGYGDDAAGHSDCEPGSGEISTGGDCDDANAAIHPDADEICDDGIDADCDSRDASCTFGGEYSMADADGKVYAEGNYFAAGEYMDVGDLDGDGITDVAYTTFYADSYNGGGGVAYGPVEGEKSADDAGDRVISSRSTYAAGRSIAIGDLNGDGIGDLALGAADETCEEYVLFGPFEGDREVADADVVRVGQNNTEYGHGSDIADVDGDGQDDLVTGAYEFDHGGNQAGAVFVEFGPISAGEEDYDDAADLSIWGEERTAYAGRYVHAGKDVDGDGIGDLLLAAPYASGGAPSGGGAYLVYGGISGELDLADADAKYVGEISGEYAGEGLTMGDVDGDGLGDVILGSMANNGVAAAGAVYIVLGPGTHVEELNSADIVMRGEATQQLFGLGLDAEDIDGDGVGDLLVGAKGDSRGGSGSGAGYLYWGPVQEGATPSDADAIFAGEGAHDGAGMSTALGDLDGDGVLDIIVGAPGDATGGGSAGAIFVTYAEL